MRECIIIGHRGAAGLAPENTLLSFHTALELGVHMIELDVHETLDGHLVCIHDSSVERTTNGEGNVAEMTLQELRRLDAGQSQKIPLLYEVLDLAHNRCKVNIELKTIGIEKSIIDLVVARGMIHEVIVSSFSPGPLQTIKELNSEMKTAILIHTHRKDLIPYAMELRADAINPQYSFVSSEMLEEAHKNSLKVHTWTVNERSQIMELLLLGVDGIITDYPNIGLDVLKDYYDSSF